MLIAFFIIDKFWLLPCSPHRIRRGI